MSIELASDTVGTAGKILELGTGREILINKKEISVDFLRMIATSEQEVSILIFDDEARVLKGQADGVNHKPEWREKLLFQIHSHPVNEVGVPSISDLDAADSLTFEYPLNNDTRFFIITSLGITEYNLDGFKGSNREKPSLAEILKSKDQPLREFYIEWLKTKYGDNKPEAKMISKDFNDEFGTSRFNTWDSNEANIIVETFKSSVAEKAIMYRFQTMLNRVIGKLTRKKEG